MVKGRLKVGIIQSDKYIYVTQMLFLFYGGTRVLKKLSIKLFSTPCKTIKHL